MEVFMTNFRNFTNGITFYVSDDMRHLLDDLSRERRVPVSVVLREIVSSNLSERKNQTKKPAIKYINRTNETEGKNA